MSDITSNTIKVSHLFRTLPISGAVIALALFGCSACGSTTSQESVQESTAAESAEQSGNTFLTAMEPYLEYLGAETENGSIEVPDELIDNRSSIGFCGIKGTVSHHFSDVSNTRITICDWVSNETVDETYHKSAQEALKSYYGGRRAQ